MTMEQTYSKPLARPLSHSQALLTHSLALLTHLLGQQCLLRSRLLLHSFIHTLTLSLTFELKRKGFLDATTHLYKRLCPSVGPSIHRSVCPVTRVIFSR